MKFKKGEITKEAFKVIMHDLECLELKETKDNNYHYKILEGNLKDIFGVSDIKKLKGGIKRCGKQ